MDKLYTIELVPEGIHQVSVNTDHSLAVYLNADRSICGSAGVEAVLSEYAPCLDPGQVLGRLGTTQQFIFLSDCKVPRTLVIITPVHLTRIEVTQLCPTLDLLL